ncbi:MAG: PilZ domain-containing protein [candidate division FCPU426 bacterium]
MLGELHEADMDIERRKFERVPCYLIARQNLSPDREEDIFGTVRNMSAGGAMIETEQELPVGTPVDLAFLLDEERQVWEGRGLIVWSRTKGEKIYLGLQFTRPLEENWERTLA